MEMFDSSGRLIGEWESSGMEEDSWCCCEAQGRFQRHNPQSLLRLQTTVRFLGLACVLLVSVTLGLVLTFVLVVRDHQASFSQPSKLSDNHAAGDAERRQVRHVEKPRAMLTAPSNSSGGRYLQWESEAGNAFCHGGFNYSSGNLVVPEDGVYRVFLQITYEGSLHQHVLPSEELKLLNAVFYYSDAYQKDICILSSVDTVNSSEEQWRKSLYTSGLFNLKANGILRVTSSHPKLIAQNEHEVFFGAERLPP